MFVRIVTVRRTSRCGRTNSVCADLARKFTRISNRTSSRYRIPKCLQMTPKKFLLERNQKPAYGGFLVSMPRKEGDREQALLPPFLGHPPPGRSPDCWDFTPRNRRYDALHVHYNAITEAFVTGGYHDNPPLLCITTASITATPCYILDVCGPFIATSENRVTVFFVCTNAENSANQ